MTDLLHERLAALRAGPDESDWDDVVRRSARRRSRRHAAQVTLLILCAGLLATPGLGLSRVLGGDSQETAPTVPMWLGLRADGTFCIALVNRCDDVDRSRRVVHAVVGTNPPLLRGYANAPRNATLELVSADGMRTPIKTRWVEEPGGVLIFAELLPPRPGSTELVLRDARGRELAREVVAASPSSGS
jgi:hypothetical protein